MQLPSFEELRHLAEHDPAGLEQLRQSIVEHAINGAPASYQRRLRGLQFRIDAERQRSSNPLSACLRLSRMMHDQLYEMVEVINDSSAPATMTTQAPSASIIPFPLLANS